MHFAIRMRRVRAFALPTLFQRCSVGKQLPRDRMQNAVQRTALVVHVGAKILRREAANAVCGDHVRAEATQNVGDGSAGLVR